MSTSSPWYRARQRSTPSSSTPTGAPTSPAMDNAAWTISSRMIAGIALYAGIGWVISLWWGNRPALIAIGAFIGLGLSYYLIFTGLAREERARQAHGVARDELQDVETDRKDRT